MNFRKIEPCRQPIGRVRVSEKKSGKIQRNGRDGRGTYVGDWDRRPRRRGSGSDWSMTNPRTRPKMVVQKQISAKKL